MILTLAIAESAIGLLQCFGYFNTSVKIYRTKKLNNGSRVTGSAI